MKDYNLKKVETQDPLAGLDDAKLLDLRHRIDMLLKTDIKDINFTEELGLQYRQGKTLLYSIQSDIDTPANQKAQVFNATSVMLEKIIRLQADVFNQERLKRYEVAFLKVLESLPEESRAIFFDLYGEFLNNKGA